MITEKKLYITTDGTIFNEDEYANPAEAKANAERYEAEYQNRYSLIGKALFFRDENLNICDYHNADFVAVLTEEAIEALNVVCRIDGYLAPWDDCNDTFKAKTGCFRYDYNEEQWVDMNMEIEKLLAAKAALIGEEIK